MSAENFEACLAFTLKEEGGDSDNPADPGGRTHKGITQATYDGYRSRHGFARQDVYTMPDAEVHDIYRKEYWDAVDGDQLRPGEDLCVFDFAVNSGPARAKSFHAISGASVEDVIHNLCQARLLFLKGLRIWDSFGSGWSRRVAACEATALRMARALTPVPTPAPQIPGPHVPVPTPAPQTLPPMSAGQAGFDAAVLNQLGASLDALLERRAAIDERIAAIRTAAQVFGKLPGAVLPPTLQIPPLKPQGNKPMSIPMTGAKPAIASSGVWGGLIAMGIPIISQISDMMGHSVDPRIQMAGSILGGILAIYGRISATTQVTGVLKP